MNLRLYHSSINPDIQVLKPVSNLHNTNDNVVYLTVNAPYALFYIWDSKHNKKSGKHITAWIKNGITYYEEQFPNQIRTFYDGVKGYLYSVDYKDNFVPVANRESMYSCESEIPIENIEVIENVYKALMEFEAKGELKVIRFEDVPNERIEDLYNHMTERLLKNKVTEKPDTEEAIFYQEYFKSVRDSAVKQNKNR